jgi:threonine/homoserine/homoserine lactone efflux protein
MFVMAAGAVATFLTGRPIWARLQRWLMGGVLAGLALRMAWDGGRR